MTTFKIANIAKTSKHKSLTIIFLHNPLNYDRHRLYNYRRLWILIEFRRDRKCPLFLLRLVFILRVPYDLLPGGANPVSSGSNAELLGSDMALRPRIFVFEHGVLLVAPRNDNFSNETFRRQGIYCRLIWCTFGRMEYKISGVGRHSKRNALRFYHCIFNAWCQYWRLYCLTVVLRVFTSSLWCLKLVLLQLFIRTSIKLRTIICYFRNIWHSNRRNNNFMKNYSQT